MTQTIAPYLLYEDVAGALEFLERAFGFREHVRLTGPEGYVNHAEARLGEVTARIDITATALATLAARAQHRLREHSRLDKHRATAIAVSRRRIPRPHRPRLPS